MNTFISKYSIALAHLTKQYNNGNINLVVLHGLMGSKNNFRGVCGNSAITKYLKSSHLLDLRNHGESPHTSTMTLPEMAQDLVEYTKDMDQIVLMGHSLGGRVIFSYLQQQLALAKLKVKGVIIIDILPGPVKSTYAFELLKKLQLIDMQNRTYNQIESDIAVAAESVPIAQLLMTNLKADQQMARKDIPYTFSWRINLEGIQQGFYSNVGTSVTADWRGPHTIICGDKSKYVGREDVEQFKAVFPDNKEVHFIENAGHWVHAEQPTKFIEQVSTFMSQLQQ